MNFVRSFAPVARPDALGLILGSMPGRLSLQRQEYYAHPRNAFWPIMGELWGFSPALAYAERLWRLQQHRIALWDVLACCRRPGSLDATIDKNSEIPNDFEGFLPQLPQLRGIFFNGRKAEQAFRRLVVPQLGTLLQDLALVGLPSTSPAYAGKSPAGKLADWKVLCDLAGI
jgi:hypoxanthine-DNA glycosylase